MKVDLSKSELDMLDAALVAWQKQPSVEGFGNALFSTMIRGMSKKEGEVPDPNEDPRIEMRKCEEQARIRERQALLLRAKLAQALAINSEHEVDEPTSAA